jgi:uncharacterized protein YdhG (YjbR/CyaY superfamily)
MKKTMSGNRRSPAKGRGAPRNVSEYLSRIPEPARGTLKKIRAAIRSAAPRGAIEILSYGIPAFRHKKVLVWYAAFANHCSLFPTSSVIREFRKELRGFTTSKGTIQFPTNKPMPAALIRKLVRERVAQIEGKKLR